MIDRFLKSKGMKGVIVSNTQYRQLNRLLNFMVNDNEKTFRKQNTYKILPEMIKCGVDNFYIERFRRVSKLSRGLTLYKLYLLYGRRNGKLKWDNYRLKQANSNSFEYKNKKYGMSYEEFVNYNKSRSTTLENMILRYGESEGTIRYNSYIEKQRVNGVKLEYFVNKYGHDKGLVI